MVKMVVIEIPGSCLLESLHLAYVHWVIYEPHPKSGFNKPLYKGFIIIVDIPATECLCAKINLWHIQSCLLSVPTRKNGDAEKGYTSPRCTVYFRLFPQVTKIVSKIVSKIVTSIVSTIVTKIVSSTVLYRCFTGCAMRLRLFLRLLLRWHLWTFTSEAFPAS